jgi:hypothetical protein
LVGFVEVQIDELAMVFRDITLHQKNTSRWATLPSKPVLKDGILVKDAEGKGQYIPVFEFTSKEARDAFSSAVVAAVLKHSPNAFDAPAAADRDVPF